jgi:hypothetical protein
MDGYLAKPVVGELLAVVKAVASQNYLGRPEVLAGSPPGGPLTWG